MGRWTSVMSARPPGELVDVLLEMPDVLEQEVGIHQPPELFPKLWSATIDIPLGIGMFASFHGFHEFHEDSLGFLGETGQRVVLEIFLPRFSLHAPPPSIKS